MTWEALMVDVMFKFLNIFVIKGTYICFGYKHKVYVISKLIVDVLGVCAKGYVEYSKGQVNKSLALQALQSCTIALANFTTH
jgi:hypothetical protein